MIATRHVTLAAALAASISLGLAGAGCKKSAPKPAPAAGSGSALVATPTPGAAGKAPTMAPIPAASGTIDPVIARTLAAMPADADVVMGINFEKLMQLPALRDAVSKYGGSRLPIDIKAECGIDPATTLRNAVIAAKGEDRAQGSLTGVTKTAMLACLEKAKAPIAARGGSITIDGVYAWGTIDARGFGMVYIDDSTALFAGGDGLVIDKSVLEAMASSTPGGGLMGVADFTGRMAQVNTDVAVWNVVDGSRLAGGMAMASAFIGDLQISSLRSAVDVGPNGMAMDLRITTPSPQSASEFVAGMGSQITAMARGGMAAKADLTAEGPDAHVVAIMTNAQLDRMWKMAKGFLGPMLGQLTSRIGGAAAAASGAAPGATPSTGRGSGSAASTAPAPATKGP